MSNQWDESTPIRSGGWAISSPHVTSSAAGAAVLRNGGTATDAALAAATALAVLLPNQCSIGGDLVALVGDPGGGVTVVNGSGRAPRGVVLEQVQPDSAWPVTVPGVVDAWFTLAAHWGERPVGSALRDAAALAADGVPVSANLARGLARQGARLVADPGTAQVFAPEGKVLKEGATLRQPALSRTLERLAEEGRETFYGGDIAESLVKSLTARGSQMSAADFDSHVTTLERPLAVPFGDSTYLSSGGNTQGGYFLVGLQLLDQLRHRLGRDLDPLAEDSAAIGRVLARLARERDLRLGDPTGSPDNLKGALANRSGRLLEEILSSPTPFRPATIRADPRTVAIVATDERGQWICVMQSVFNAFGAAILDPTTGVLFHDRGRSFSLRPGQPNSLGGSRRPPHTLMPVLTRHAATGRVTGVHGTMGGPAQHQIHTHLALHLRRGRDAIESVTSPRWVIAAPSSGSGAARSHIVLEQDVPAAAVVGLSSLELPLAFVSPRSDDTGHAQMIRAVIDERDAVVHLRAASDPRGGGQAVTGAVVASEDETRPER